MIDHRSSALERLDLRAQIRELILARIAAGEYEPGSRLVETRIARELGVSQAPVREALRDLEQLGCIVHEPFRGCSVRAFSAGELLDAFPVRAALEALAARLAAERITPDELDGLEVLLDRMRAAAGRGDEQDRARASAEFHTAIMHAAANPTLERHWTFLGPFTRSYVSVSAPDVDLVEATEQHVRLLEALRRGDGEEAAAAMHHHLRDAADVLRPIAERESDTTEGAKP